MGDLIKKEKENIVSLTCKTYIQSGLEMGFEGGYFM